MRTAVSLFLLALPFLVQAQVAPEIRNIDSGSRYTVKTDADIETGAEQIHTLVEDLQFKRIGVVANHTYLIGSTHLVDSLLGLGLDVRLIFTPEHGFRGDADAGEKVMNQKDQATRLPVISLYGSNKKPKLKDLIEVDVVLYDLQDVGVRFYTYISTLYYVMEACAEAERPLYVLDRPNPLGFLVDGPVLDPAFKSFVGLTKIPVIYGMTAGEYATMVNEEGWLYNQLKCDLNIMKLKGYTHNDLYQLPVAPSPNLPNMAAVYLYPSLCFFEGTVVSVGRGTNFPFQVYGHPELKGDFSFTPESKIGARVPKLEGKKCFGEDLRSLGENYVENPFGLNLTWLLGAHEKLKNREEGFFLENDFINLLAGSANLKYQVEEGYTEAEIRETWQTGLTKFKAIRSKYLLY